MAKRTKGSAKGSSFERLICTRLSLWWSNHLYDDLFWRTQASGARATMRARRSKSTAGQYGDVCATDERGRAFTKMFTISIKRGYSKHTIQDSIDGQRRLFEEFFVEVELQARMADSLSWMLISQRDRRQMMIWLPYPLSSSLRLHIMLDDFAHVRTQDVDVIGFRFEDFVGELDPIIFTRYIERLSA